MGEGVEVLDSGCDRGWVSKGLGIDEIPAAASARSMMVGHLVFHGCIGTGGQRWCMLEVGGNISRRRGDRAALVRERDSIQQKSVAIHRIQSTAGILNSVLDG